MTITITAPEESWGANGATCRNAVPGVFDGPAVASAQAIGLAQLPIRLWIGSSIDIP